MRGISLSLALLAAGAAAQKPSCSKGLYMIVARGSGEPNGTGVSSNITSAVAAKIPDSQVVAVDYPATLNDYDTSEGDGVSGMQKLINNYAQACPGNKIALVGYSQGAQVAMDSVCGGLGGSFTADQPISAQIMDNSVVAVAVFGDPSHVANLTYDRGTSKNNGIFPRNNTSVCLKYASKIISYCDTGDIYCDQGTNVTVHHEYIIKYGTDLADFIINKFQQASSTSGSNSSSGANATVTTAAPTASQTGPASTASGSASPSASPKSAAAGLAPATSSLLFGAGLFTVLTAVSQLL